jgi:hypothetical protein
MKEQDAIMQEIESLKKRLDDANEKNRDIIRHLKLVQEELEHVICVHQKAERLISRYRYAQKKAQALISLLLERVK